MTRGPIFKRLVVFAVPLLLGNLLQQTYNAFDAIVVGNFVSIDALAAVGASGPLITMLVSFFMGMSNGSGVLISRFYGARNAKELRNAVHTAITLAFLIGAALSALGYALSPALLRLIRTPEEVFPDALTYLRIYFTGLIGVTVYNMGAAVLTATGDSKRPLFFLALSAALNIAMNLLFVLVFNLGVAGVAYSTIISQALCAALVIALLCRQPTVIRVDLKKLKIHGYILKEIVRLGLPGGIQGMIVSASNVGVQSYVNALGPAAIAGYGAGSRVDGYIFMPIQSMVLATSTFVGQNLGAKKVKRAREGVRVSMITSLGITVFMSALLFFFGKYVLRAFTPDVEVIAYGLEFIRIFIPCYFMLCFAQILPGAMRGAGDVKVPTLTSIGAFVVMRQIYLFLVTKVRHTVFTVALGYPITWFTAAAIIIIHYLKSDWSAFEGEFEESRAFEEFLDVK